MAMCGGRLGAGGGVRWCAAAARVLMVCGAVGMCVTLAASSGAWGAGVGRGERMGGEMIGQELLREKREAWESRGLSGGGAMYTPATSPHDPNLMMVSCDMSCAFRSADGGESWDMIHHQYLLASTQCRPVFHPSDPDVIFAVNGWRGELKVSRDRGVTWEPVSEQPPRGVRALAIDRGNGNLLLAGSWESGSSSVSADGGKSWRGCEGLRGSVVGLHIDQTSPVERRRCFAGTSEGVFRSEDGGLTWEQIGEGLPEGELRDFAGGSDAERDECVLYCTAESAVVEGKFVGGVYRSRDGGQTWAQAMGEGIDTEAQERRGRLRVPQYRFVLTTDVRPETVYAVNERAGQVYRSDDGGGSWRPTLFTRMEDAGFNIEPHYITAETGGWGETISGVGINPADPDMVMVTDWMCCYVTRDGGRTWGTLHTRRAEGQGAAGKGQRWENTGLVVTTVWHYYIDPFEKNRHHIAYTDIGYARSEDAGKTWYWQHGRPLRNTTYEIAFDPEVRGKMWAAFANVHDIPNANIILERHGSSGGGGVGISDDFGVTWGDTSEGLPDSTVMSVVVDPRSPAGSRTLYASVWEHGVFKSVDDGKTWEKKSEGLGAPESNMRVCRIILHEDGTLFCLVTALMKERVFQAGGPGLYRSRDGGESWEWINESQPLLWPKDFDVDPRDSGVIYMGAADAGRERDGGLYKTTDGGETWGRVAREARETFGATVDPRRPDWVYMALCEGAPGPALWLSKDGGETWEAFWGLPFRNVQRVSFDPDDESIIYVCTFGGSVWKGPAEP